MDPIHQKEAEKGCGNSVWVEHASTKSSSSDAEPDEFLLEGADITKLEKKIAAQDRSQYTSIDGYQHVRFLPGMLSCS